MTAVNLKGPGPFRLGERVRRAGHAVAYLVVSLPVTLLAWPALVSASRS